MPDLTFPRVYLSFAIAAILCGCLLGPRAGTSTTTENTLTGVARLAGGGAAAGASVTARSTDINLSGDKIPSSKVLASAVAGPDGGFTLDVPGRLGFYLEIEAVVHDSMRIVQAGSGDGSEIWFREFDPPADTLTELGEVRLEPAATVFGRLESDGDWAGQSVWIGIPGTGRFTRLDFPATGDSSVAFILERVPPGDQPLVLVVPGDVVIAGNAQTVDADTLGTAKAVPGTSSNVGTLTLRGP